MSRLSTLATVISAAAAGEVASPDGIYCGSGKYWSSLNFKVDSAAHTIEASGIADKTGAAPWHLDDMNFHMSEDGTDMVVTKEHQPKDRQLYIIGGTGYKAPVWTELPYNAESQTITVSYKEEEMVCSYEKCPAGQPAHRGEFSGPDGTYCCTDGLYWSFILFKVDGAGNAFDVSGIANLPNVAPWHESGVSFRMNKENTLMEIISKKTEESRKLHNIGDFHLPYPLDWDKLTFDAEWQQIRIPYDRDYMVCENSKCPAGSPASSGRFIPDGMYCCSGYTLKSLIFNVDYASRTFSVSAIANVTGAAPYFKGGIHFHMSEDTTFMVVDKKPESRELQPHAIGGFDRDIPKLDELHFNPEAQTITASDEDDMLVCSFDQCPANSPMGFLPGLPNGMYCCSSFHWKNVFFNVDYSSGTLIVSGMARTPGAAPWYLSDIHFHMEDDNTVMQLGKARALRSEHAIGGFGRDIPKFDELHFNPEAQTITASDEDDMLVSLYWKNVFFNVDYSAGTLVVSGMARTPGAAP
ncbi:hypothetical protein FOZ62_014149, partial [Perkinsus olseni]